MPTHEPKSSRKNVTLDTLIAELNLEEIQGNCLELAVEIDPRRCH